MSIDTIELSEVGYSYDTRPAVHDITASIKRGSYVGIVGPNGSGKTTLIKLIVGLLTPTYGSVRIFGHSVRNAQQEGIIGYVSQGVAQNIFSFPASVSEVVSSGGLHAREPVAEALDAVGMLEQRDRLIAQLSGGQRQRVFIARALVTHPSLLVLDEPTTGVDAAEQSRFYELLASLHQHEKVTILYVSHDLDVIAGTAQQVLCVNGTLVCSIPAKDILSPSVIKSLYGDAMSVIKHHHHGPVA